MLRWRELFAKYVPDSYRPRLMDTPGVLRELEWVSELAHEDTRWKRQLGLVISELKQITEKDRLTQVYSPRLYHAIQDLSLETKPGQCNSIARLGLEEVEAYGDWGFDELAKLLDEAGSKTLKRKDEAEFLLGLVATRAIQRGFGRNYCEQLVGDEQLGEKATHVLEALRSGLNGTEREWLCIYALRSSERGERGTIRQMLKNLEYYFATALNWVLHDIAQRPGWTMMDALQSRAMDWTLLCNALKKEPHVLTVVHLNLTETPGQFSRVIWPAK